MAVVKNVLVMTVKMSAKKGISAEKENAEEGSTNAKMRNVSIADNLSWGNVLVKT